MNTAAQGFTTRQYMITPDFEFFHYRDVPDVEIGYHNHDFYEIFYFISGNVTYLVEGTSYRLKAGDILLVNNRELHKPVIEERQPYERIVLWLNPEFLKRQSVEGTDLTDCFESSSKRRHNLLRPEGEQSVVFKNILGRLEKVISSSGYGSSILQSLYVTELIVCLNNAFKDSPENIVEVDVGYNEKISSIISYINENLDGELSLDFISEKFYVSKYHLLREFKKYAGYTIHSYVRKKRLIKAKALLREGVQVSEVYIRCGFGDYSNFIRSFRQAYGLSPKKYAGLQ
jgi:AraC-like DNA-binding protein/mannose-6-phosphate isomerase-like protein (cupin superfamily)